MKLKMIIILRMPIGRKMRVSMNRLKKEKPASKTKKGAGKMVPYVLQNPAKGKSKMAKAGAAWADTCDDEADYWYLGTFS